MRHLKNIEFKAIFLAVLIMSVWLGLITSIFTPDTGRIVFNAWHLISGDCISYILGGYIAGRIAKTAKILNGFIAGMILLFGNLACWILSVTGPVLTSAHSPPEYFYTTSILVALPLSVAGSYLSRYPKREAVFYGPRYQKFLSFVQVPHKLLIALTWLFFGLVPFGGHSGHPDGTVGFFLLGSISAVVALIMSSIHLYRSKNAAILDYLRYILLIIAPACVLIGFGILQSRK